MPKTKAEQRKDLNQKLQQKALLRKPKALSKDKMKQISQKHSKAKIERSELSEVDSRNFKSSLEVVKRDSEKR